MNHNRTTKKILDIERIKQRKNDQPKTWMQQIKEVRRRGDKIVEEIKTVAKNRTAWERWVQDNVHNPNPTLARAYGKEKRKRKKYHSMGFPLHYDGKFDSISNPPSCIVLDVKAGINRFYLNIVSVCQLKMSINHIIAAVPSIPRTRTDTVFPFVLT